MSAGFGPWRVRPHRVRPHIDSSSDQVLQIYHSHSEKKDNIVRRIQQNMFISRSLIHEFMGANSVGANSPWGETGIKPYIFGVKKAVLVSLWTISFKRYTAGASLVPFRISS